MIQLLLALLSASLAFAAPPRSPSVLEGALEPEYADAILKFQKGAHQDAVRSLEALLAKLGTSGPALRDRRRVLELQAQALEQTGDDAKARALHEKILALAKEQGADEQEVAPSLFELAMLDLKAGQREPARRGFEHSLKLDYNRQACHFLLGYLDFQDHELQASARRFRLSIAEPGSDDLRALAGRYLSRFAADEGDGATALRYAKQAGADTSAAEQAAGFHEYAGLDLRFDSNAVFLPLGPNPTDSGFLTNDGPSAASIEMNLWLGYVSSPLESWQWSIGGRSRIINHLGAQARDTDFFNQALELELGHNPLEPVSFGFRAALAMLWAGQELEPYRLQESLGAYFRRELRPALVLSAAFDAHPSKNFFDRRVPDVLDRSGPSYDLRVSLFSEGARGLWNPGFSVWMGLAAPSGDEFRSRAIAFEFNNLYFATQRLSGSFGGTAGISAYIDRPTKARYDPFLGLEGTMLYSLSARYSLSGRASLIEDFSTVGVPYRFGRFTLGTGIVLHI